MGDGKRGGRGLRRRAVCERLGRPGRPGLGCAWSGQVRSQLQPLSRAHDAASGREGAWAAESFRACALP